MTPRQILVAASAAIVGALAWGALTYFTGYEVGYVAWGVGLLVGGTAVAFGGRGSLCGVVCAGLAVGAIFLGKVLAVQFSIDHELKNIATQALSREQYDESVQEAADFAALSSPGDYPKFMVEHGYVVDKPVNRVTTEEIHTFEQESIPNLRWLQTEKPSYEDWRARRNEHIDEFTASLPIASLVFENLGAIDLIFAFLGIGTAYKLPARKEEVGEQVISV